MGITSPCKDCQERTSTCHAVCERYVDWKKRLEIGAAARQKERDAEKILCRKVQRQIWREMKERR